MHDFTQFGFSEEANAAANEILDFTACMRADGSVYGTAGQCRLGTETQKKVNEPLRAYVKLMKEAKRRPTPPSEERAKYAAHHAFPKAIFKLTPAREKRKVWLTHEEHFDAHTLLHEALMLRYGPKDKRTLAMGTAIHRMATGKDGNKLSKEQQAKAREVWQKTNKERMNTPEMRARMGAIHRGKKYGPETRQKIADAKRGVQASPEARKAMQEAQRKVVERNPELKNQQVRAANEARWAKEGAQDKQAGAMRKRWEDPEKRQAYGDKFKKKKWYNDGKVNLRVEDGSPIPEGFSPGRFQTPEQKAQRAQKLKETAERKRKEKEQNG